MNIFNPQILSNLIYEIPDRSGKTIRHIARAMGNIDERYLARQLNPDDLGAKLGIEDFIYLTAVTDNKPLDYIEQSLGRIGVPLPSNHYSGEGKWYRHISRITKETGECIGAMAKIVGKSEANPKTLHHCMCQTYEAMQAFTALYIDLTAALSMNDKHGG